MSGKIFRFVRVSLVETTCGIFRHSVLTIKGGDCWANNRGTKYTNTNTQIHTYTHTQIHKYSLETTCGISRHSLTRKGGDCWANNVAPDSMNDGRSIWRLLPISYISINQDFRFEHHGTAPYGRAVYPLCADLVEEHFTPTCEKHTDLTGTCSS